MFVSIDIQTSCAVRNSGISLVDATALMAYNAISIGNRMNASAFRDLWARVMF